MPPAPENLLLTPLPTPWGHRHGPPDGSGLSRYPGPLRGEVTASWTPPASAQASSGPIVTTDGRIAIALDDKVVFLEPGSLLPIGEIEMAHAELSVAEGDRVLAAGRSDARRIDPQRRYELLPLRPGWKEHRVRRLYDLHDGRVLALGDSTAATFGPEGLAEQRALTASMSPVIGASALAPDGRLYVANASSYSSEDEPVQYFGHVVELALPSLEPRWTAGPEVITRVSSTGFRLRVIAVPQGVLVVEGGALLLSGQGSVIAQWTDEVVKGPLVVDGRDLFHAKGRPVTICHTMLPGGPGAFYPPPVPVFRFEDGESVYDMVGAGGNLYAATSQRLVAFRRDGTTLWEMPRFSPYQLACGNGCLYALERPLKLSRVG